MIRTSFFCSLSLFRSVHQLIKNTLQRPNLNACRSSWRKVGKLKRFSLVPVFVVQDIVYTRVPIQSRQYFTSVGNLWRLTPSFVVLLQPAATHTPPWHFEGKGTFYPLIIILISITNLKLQRRHTSARSTRHRVSGSRPYVTTLLMFMQIMLPLEGRGQFSGNLKH